MRALIRDLGIEEALALDRFAPAEAQVAAIADDIAYTNHDIDDGLRAGLLHLADLANAPMARRIRRQGGRLRARRFPDA